MQRRSSGGRRSRLDVACAWVGESGILGGEALSAVLELLKVISEMLSLVSRLLTFADILGIRLSKLWKAREVGFCGWS